jgi:hypothetical protein
MNLYNINSLIITFITIFTLTLISYPINLILRKFGIRKILFKKILKFRIITFVLITSIFFLIPNKFQYFISFFIGVNSIYNFKICILILLFTIPFVFYILEFYRNKIKIYTLNFLLNFCLILHTMIVSVYIIFFVYIVHY